MKKFKIKGRLTVVGTISFPDEEDVLKDYRESIDSGANLERIAESVLATYAEGDEFVEGVGDIRKDYNIDDYDEDWDLEEIK